MVNFHRRKSMDMDIRELILDTLKHPAVIKHIPVGKKTSLDTHLCSIDTCRRPCLIKNFGYRHDIAILFLECAEFACPCAPVREIYIPVYYIGNTVPGCFFSKHISQG